MGQQYIKSGMEYPWTEGRAVETLTVMGGSARTVARVRAQSQ
jgi:hypothetical protein